MYNTCLFLPSTERYLYPNKTYFLPSSRGIRLNIQIYIHYSFRYITEYLPLAEGYLYPNKRYLLASSIAQRIRLYLPVDICLQNTCILHTFNNL